MFGLGSLFKLALGGLGGAKGAALGGLGSILGAFGTSQTQTREGWDTMSGTRNIDMMKEALEPEYFSAFRQGLIDRFMTELGSLQGPSLAAQQAAIVQNTGKMADDAIKATRAALARMGRLDSGSADTLTSNIMAQMAGQRATELSDLPFRLMQQRMAMVQPMLGLGAQWAGQAPVSYRDFGTEMTNQRRDFYEKAKGGTPWWRSALGGLGGAFGAAFVNNLPER